MLDLFNKDYQMNSDKVLYFDSDSQKQFMTQVKSCNKNIKHVIINNDCLCFENIVEGISYIEDYIGIMPISIDVSISKSKKTFFELLDFYNTYDVNINIIADSSFAPFDIIHNIFSLNEVCCYSNYGICMNLNSLPLYIWGHSTVLAGISQYMNSSFYCDKYYTKKI
jgi:hypothetical protein